MDEISQPNRINSSVAGFFGLFLGFFIMISTIFDNPPWSYILDFYGTLGLLIPEIWALIVNFLIASVIYLIGRRYFQNFNRGFFIGVLIALVPMLFIWGVWEFIIVPNARW